MATTPAPQPADAPRRRHGAGDEDEGSRRYRTVYVDFHKFETKLGSRHCDTGRGRYAPRSSPRPWTRRSTASG